jgi:hypothetical protein
MPAEHVAAVSGSPAISVTDHCHHPCQRRRVSSLIAEDLVTGDAREVDEILVVRDELMLVHATGPRGARGRRVRTRQAG